MKKITWISIKDKLPNPEEYVVILLNNGMPVIAKFNGFVFTEDGLEFENIAYWLHLPEMPKITT